MCRKLFIFSLFCLLTGLMDNEFMSVASAQQRHKVYEFKIHYPKDRVQVDTSYMGNKGQIEKLQWFIDNVSTFGDSLIIYSYASPEGPYWNNARLAKGRGEAARKFLQSLFPDKTLADSIVIINHTPENWDGLRDMVDKEYHFSDRSKVLDILDSSLAPDEKKRQLKKVSWGNAWLYILNNYMPRLRYATWVCKLQDPHDKIQVVPVVKSKVSPQIDRQGTIQITPIESSYKEYVPEKKNERLLFALKTNLLYDLATIVNFGIEVPFKNKFSFLYEHHCPWWLSDNNKYCMQNLSLGGEFRWWFKSDNPLSGHFLGVHCWSGKGDIQIGRNFGCYQYEFWSTGFTYGYSIPLSKRLNMEFALSVGYAHIPYRHYIPTDDWQILLKDPAKKGALNYFGPTKAQINLVIPVKSRRGGNSR